MKIFCKLFFVILLCVAGSAAFSSLQAASAADKKPKLTKEEKQAERTREIAERATAATKIKVREGRHPSYNILLKSTSYDVMFREGMRYYNMKKRGKEYNKRSSYVRAQNLFEAVVRSQYYAGTSKDDSLYYFYGCSFFMAQDFEVSEQAFDEFRRTYLTSPFLEDAEYKYAMGFYFLSPEPEHDQSTTVKAMSAIAEYEGRYPNTAHKEVIDIRMEELRRKLYVKSFENARLYYTIEQYKAAVKAIGNAIDEFPESPYREELMYLATRSAYLLARNSVTSMMTDRYMNMMDNYYNLISEYPETEYLREVEQMRDEAREYIEKNTNESVTATQPVITSENGN